MEKSVARLFDRTPNKQMTTDEIVDYYVQHEIAQNGLLVTIDYLEFTLFVDRGENADITGREIEAIEDVLQLDSNEFLSLPQGMNGYPKRLKWTPTSLFVLYGAGARQGVHVTMSGNACRTYVSTVGDLLLLMLRINALKGKVTRIDLAVDDLETQFYSIAELVECYQKHEIVTRWKSMEQQYKSDIESQINLKECLYFGSMKSDCFLRVYNKTIEQMNKEQRPIAEIAAAENVWTRWELVLRRDAAQSVLQLVMGQMPLGEIWCGIMANYFRVTVACEDSNHRRWETQEKWARFVGAALPLSIKSYPAIRDISTLKDWLSSQIMPSLAAVMEAEGSLEWIAQNILNSVNRINPYYRSLIDDKKGSY